MYKPSLNEFLKFTRKGNVIPVYKEINADLDTPVSTFLKIEKNNYAFLLESVEGQEKIARYSFLGNNPVLVLKSKARNIEIHYPQKKQSFSFVTKNTPLDELKRIMENFKAVSVSGLPRFYGGLVGYIGYDTVRFFERIPDKNPDDLKLPDCIFILTETMLIFDHVVHKIKLVTNVILPKEAQRLSKIKKVKLYHNAMRNIEALQKTLNRPVTQKEKFIPNNKEKPKIASNFTKTGFKYIINVAKDYIKRGDIIQVVLSQRFKIKIDKSPFRIYRKLRSLNPSPYMFFLKFKDLTLIGSSPEMLVRCEDGIIQTRPIAGTRQRGKTEEEDKKLENELLNDKKERAEHLMLVDLGRNDLGRVSLTDSIKVNEFMSVEKYSHVMHLVSEVRGRLNKRKYDIYEVLKAAFPAGTVTGSPKIRAMEIIDELENLRRGPYAGSVGYFSFSHNIDTCITIRTIITKGKFAYIQAGAGIVADSVAENEYLESVNKARVLIEAIVK